MFVLWAAATAGACTPPTFDHCAVAFNTDICPRWRLLRERRLSAQGECSTGGDAIATVAATFTAFLNEVPGLHDRFEPRGEQLRGRCQLLGDRATPTLKRND
jgi:hypothetical protein